METRVYVVNTYDYDFDTFPNDWDDEKFMSEAEIQGSVYSLEGFVRAFNSEEISPNTDFIRIISVEV